MSFIQLGSIQILLLIRDKKANTWEALCEKSGTDPNSDSTGNLFLLDELERLKLAGLIDFEIDKSKSKKYTPKFKGDINITDSWRKIQAVLGISLAQLAEINSNDLVVRPYLGRPHDPPHDLEKNDLFVLMPFTEALRHVYDDHIKKVSMELNLTVARADDFFSAHSIMQDVWNGIFHASAIIADCTGRNPNVFYEIGLAHVLGKPVILITQNEEDVPFDVRGMRYTKYDTSTRRHSEHFEFRLKQCIRYVMGV